MDLKRYERTESGELIQLVRPLENAQGRASHRLVITGREDLIRSAFADGDPQVTIVPGGEPEGWEQRWQDTVAEGTRRPLQLGTDVVARKKPPGKYRDEVFVGVEQLEAGGTWYALTTPLFVPRGVSVVFFMPWICTGNAMIAPAAGDQDLFVTFNGSPTIVAASMLGGTAVDRVSFATRTCWPWDNVIAFVRVFGFATGAGSFFMSGFGLP
jgi:hypothetical protein